MLAIGKRPQNTVFWFATRSEKETDEWLAAMISTIPEPPQYQRQPPPQPPPYQYPRPQALYPQQRGGYHQHDGGHGHYGQPRPPHRGQYQGYPGQYRGRRDSGPGFGTGMLAGGLLGWGLGGGLGWGGHHQHGGYWSNTDITNTSNEINNTEVNNYYGDEWGAGDGGGLPGMTEDFGGGMDFDMGDFGGDF